MLAVCQRVSAASVEVGGKQVGVIEKGLLLFLGVETEDTEAEGLRLAKKVSELRIFTDENDKMNWSVKDIGGGILLIPNFTLCGNCRHGRRPEFMRAARPEQANPLFEQFAVNLSECGVTTVQTGVFGADMAVKADNDGPVTLILNTKDWS
jgi:D-tyrosyl-tRNA(Tyr) deacylase